MERYTKSGFGSINDKMQDVCKHRLWFVPSLID